MSEPEHIKSIIERVLDLIKEEHTMKVSFGQDAVGAGGESNPKNWYKRQYLCWECREWRANHLREHGFPDEINQCPPYFHCHHEAPEEKPKEKCWCDYPGTQRRGTMWADTKYGPGKVGTDYDREWFFFFCGACGRSFEEEKKAT